MEAREAKGAFGSLEEFCRRAGPGMANRRVLESLVPGRRTRLLGPRGQLLAAVIRRAGGLDSEGIGVLERSGQATMFDLFGQSVPTPLGGLRFQEASEPSTNERGLWDGSCWASPFQAYRCSRWPRARPLTLSSLEVTWKSSPLVRGPW